MEFNMNAKLRRKYRTYSPSPVGFKAKARTGNSHGPRPLPNVPCKKAPAGAKTFVTARGGQEQTVLLIFGNGRRRFVKASEAKTIVAGWS